MSFWKNHEKLRMAVITLFTVLGVVATIVGWKMTGELVGLGIMVVGVACLLVALAVYNQTFKTPSRKK